MKLINGQCNFIQKNVKNVSERAKQGQLLQSSSKGQKKERKLRWLVVARRECTSAARTLELDMKLISWAFSWVNEAFEISLFANKLNINVLLYNLMKKL